MSKIFAPSIKDKHVKAVEIQTRVIPFGKGELYVTGLVDSSIIDVVQISYNLLRSKQSKFNLEKNVFETFDLHVHFPHEDFIIEGSSIGLAVFISLLEEYRVIDLKNSSILATGTLDILGNILPVGGIKLKASFYKRNTGKFDCFINPTLKHIDNLLLHLNHGVF